MKSEQRLIYYLMTVKGESLLNRWFDLGTKLTIWKNHDIGEGA